MKPIAAGIVLAVCLPPLIITAATAAEPVQVITIDGAKVGREFEGIGALSAGASSRPFPLPYADDFESYGLYATPRYLSDQFGIFEVQQGPEGIGKCLKQVITIKGIDWPSNPSRLPETLLGDARWTDYEIAVELMLPSEGSISLFGRVSKQDFNSPAQGYQFSIADSGHWALTANGTEIAQGETAFEVNRWYSATMAFKDDTVEVRIGDVQVLRVEDDACSAGLAGLGSGLHEAWFDNFSVRPLN